MLHLQLRGALRGAGLAACHLYQHKEQSTGGTLLLVQSSNQLQSHPQCYPILDFKTKGDQNTQSTVPVWCFAPSKLIFLRKATIVDKALRTYSKGPIRVSYILVGGLILFRRCDIFIPLLLQLSTCLSRSGTVQGTDTVVLIFVPCASALRRDGMYHSELYKEKPLYRSPLQCGQNHELDSYSIFSKEKPSKKQLLHHFLCANGLFVTKRLVFSTDPSEYQ